MEKERDIARNKTGENDEKSKRDDEKIGREIITRTKLHFSPLLSDNMRF